jgi:hypothetical protein
LKEWIFVQLLNTAQATTESNLFMAEHSRAAVFRDAPPGDLHETAASDRRRDG